MLTAARRTGLGVKMVGSGHSFTDIAVANELMLRPDRLVGIRSVDRDAMTVTALSGTPLHVLNDRLHAMGLALHNLGDIGQQTIAGAISTGTHGTGGFWASLSAQVAGLEIVTADGAVVQTSTSRDVELFHAARVGLGALGIITAVTVMVEPAFTLDAVEQPLRWDEAVDRYEQLVSENHHLDMYWFPHTDTMLVKRNNRAVDSAQPLSSMRAWVEDELVANTIFGAVNRLGNTIPRTVPWLNRISARALTARSYSDASHRVLTSPRRVVFKEMEYALPREVGITALAEVRGSDRTVVVGDQLSRRDPVHPRRRHLAVDRERPGVGLPGLPRQRADRPHAVLLGRRAIAQGVRRAPPLGQAAHANRGGPRPLLRPLG